MPDWMKHPGKPWIGAIDYTSSEDEMDKASTQKSSEEVQKARLGEEVADLEHDQQIYILATGGKGARGNASVSRKRK